MFIVFLGFRYFGTVASMKIMDKLNDKINMVNNYYPVLSSNGSVSDHFSFKTFM